jgi:hypothetical protein
VSPAARARAALIAAPLAGVLLVLVQWWPMIAAHPHTPEFDGRYAFQQFEIAKASLRQYGEIALWNPFDCRGMPMWDFPESMTGSPIFLLTTVFDDTLIAYYAWNIVHAIAGFFAMWILARRGFALGRLASFVGAAMWSVGAWQVIQCAGNHETFVSFYLAPLFLHLWRRAEERLDAAVLAGLLLAWMIYDGGTYAVPFSLVLLGIETMTRLRSPQRVKRIALAALVAGVFAVAVSASRLLPLVDQLTQNRRALPPDTDHMLRGATLFASLFYRGPDDPLGHGFPGQQYGFDEYVIYFGIFGVAAALIGAVFAWKQHRWTIFVAGVMAVFALGHFAPWSPWTLLQGHVFPFSALRVSSRFILFVALFMCVWMALAVERLSTMSHRAQIAMTALAFAAVLDTMEWGREVVAKRFTGAPVAAVVASPRFYYGLDDAQHPDFINHPRQNHAWQYCRATSFSFHQDAAIWTGDVAQARAVGEGATITSVERTHNTFRLEIEARERTQILLDSAYERGWQTNDGEVVANGDLLALWVEPGHHSVRMRYWPRRLTLGIVVSCVGLLAAVLVLLSSRRRRATSPCD